MEITSQEQIKMRIRTSVNGGPMETRLEGGKKKAYVVQTPLDSDYFESGKHEVAVEEGNPILEKVGVYQGFELKEGLGRINYDPEWAKGGKEPSPYLGMTRVPMDWDEPGNMQRQAVELEQAIERRRREADIAAVMGGDARTKEMELQLATLKLELEKMKQAGGQNNQPASVDNARKPKNKAQSPAQ